MEDSAPTRTNLLQRRAQVQIAVQGVDLLKNKRDVLIREFMKLMEEMIDRRHDLEDLAHRAYHALAASRAFDGDEALRSAAMAAGRTVTVDIRRRKIWGVPVPDIERIVLDRQTVDRGYSFAGVPAGVDAVARRFEGILTSLVAVAATDVVLRRIGDEIKRTTRRVNALEQVLVPRLKADARAIAMALEEREREDVSRLKLLRRRSGKGSRGRSTGRRRKAG